MRVTKCWDTASYWWRKWTSFPVLSSKLRPVLKLLDQYGFPNTCAPKLFFSIPLTLKTRYELPIISLRHALMIQEISRRFDKLKFIFIEFSGPTTIMQSWTVPLNKIPAMVAFDSHLTSLSLSLSLSFSSIENKDMKKLLPFSPQLEESSIVSLFTCLGLMFSEKRQFGFSYGQKIRRNLGLSNEIFYYNQTYWLHQTFASISIFIFVKVYT